MLCPSLPERLQRFLAVIVAGEPLDSTILVKMSNYIPVRNRLVQSLVAYCQYQWDVVGKVRKKAPTQ